MVLTGHRPPINRPARGKSLKPAGSDLSFLLHPIPYCLLRPYLFYNSLFAFRIYIVVVKKTSGIQTFFSTTTYAAIPYSGTLL